MTAKALIVLALVWLVAVALWLSFGPKSFFHMWHAQGVAKRTLVIVGIYLVGLLYQVFVIGWVIPLALGVYRLARQR